MKKQTIKLFSIGLIIMLLASCTDDKSKPMRISSWVSSPAETELFRETLKHQKDNNLELDFVYEPIPGNYSENYN